MLRYQEKEDLEARLGEVERTVARWRRCISEVSPRLRKEFHEQLVISLIYHDAALEGDVLTYSEIKTAIDPTIISDRSLIAGYEHIKRYYDACLFIGTSPQKSPQKSLQKSPQKSPQSRKRILKLETIRELYAILAPEEKSHQLRYRQENPLHRLYYHDIAPPEKIEEAMQGFAEWLDEPATRQMSPIDRVAETHFRLMSIFPWAKQSGRCARLVSNLILHTYNYPTAVLHSIDRQLYYEALRTEPRALVSLYLEAVETAALSEMRVYEQAA